MLHHGDGVIDIKMRLFRQLLQGMTGFDPLLPPDKPP
jgi:hypothetical protein